MTISVIIPCHKDPRIHRCLESLTANKVAYEVIVVLTQASTALAGSFESYSNVKVVWAPVGNLSKSLNLGIAGGQFDKFVVLNADVICNPGYLDIFEQELNQHVLVSSRFCEAQRCLSERVVAELREYIHALDVFYCPCMGFRRELKDYVGGYYFNENVYWTEDAELTFRIHKTTLSIKRREDAIVVHDPESLPYDLKGAFKIGSGKFSQLVHAGRSWQEESIVTGFKHLLGGKTLRECVQIAQTKSVATAIYALIWKVFYYAGHWYKRLMYACSKPMTLAAASFAAGART